MKKTILLKKLISIVLAGAAALAVCACNPFDSGAGKKAKAAISSAISKAYSSITDRYSSNGSVPLEQMNSYVNDLYGKTDELLESGDITYREKQNSYVYVKDKNGSGVFLCAPDLPEWLELPLRSSRYRRYCLCTAFRFLKGGGQRTR